MQIAVTRTSLSKVENLFKKSSSGRLEIASMVCSWWWSAEPSSIYSSSICSSIWFWFFSHVSPFHYNWELHNSLGDVPLDIRSAGFSFVPTWFQSSTEINSWIFPTKTDSFLLVALIQHKTIVSLHPSSNQLPLFQCPVKPWSWLSIALIIARRTVPV